MHPSGTRALSSGCSPYQCFIVQKSGNVYKETLRLALCTLLSYMSTYKVYIVQEVCSLKFPLKYNSKVYLVMFTIPLSQKWVTIYKSRYCGVPYFHYILSNCIATTYQIDSLAIISLKHLRNISVVLSVEH